MACRWRPGNDQILVQPDGNRDDIRCGPAEDTVEQESPTVEPEGGADPHDVIADDCETVVEIGNRS